MRCVLTLSELELNDPRSPGNRTQRRFLCPFCGNNKPRNAAHRSLCLNASTGAWICHRCGERGLLNDYWSEPQIGASVEIESKAVITLANALRPVSGFNWRRVWSVSSRLCGTPGANYVERRGIPARFAEFCGARFSAAWYRRPALLFPVKDETGQLVAVSGRYVDGRNSPKTMAAGRKSLGAFSTPGALEAAVVAIVEGPIDALSLALCGLPAVAMIGTSWAEWLPRSLSPKPILIATDSDEVGDEVAQRLHEVFTGNGCQALRLRPSCGKDWNDVLIRMGSPSLQDALKGFAPGASDAMRRGFARRLRMSGRTEAAAFIESLYDQHKDRRTFAQP